MEKVDSETLFKSESSWSFNFDLIEAHASTFLVLLVIGLLIAAIVMLWRTLNRERKQRTERRCNGNTEYITRKDFEEYKDHADRLLTEFKEENADDHKRMRDNFDRVFRSLEQIGKDIGRLLGRTEK